MPLDDLVGFGDCSCDCVCVKLVDWVWESVAVGVVDSVVDAVLVRVSVTDCVIDGVSEVDSVCVELAD